MTQPKQWVNCELVESGGKFSVRTRILRNPVDALARKAMGCPDEIFENLSLATAIKQADKFEAWRAKNDPKRSKR